MGAVSVAAAMPAAKRTKTTRKTASRREGASTARREGADASPREGADATPREDASATPRGGAEATRRAAVAASPCADPAAALVAISRRLARDMARLRFAAPVAHVYAPLVYAREPHERFLALARPGIDALFVGMNPGPFGMAQTGVPFGEIAAVRGFLGIEGRVTQPRDARRSAAAAPNDARWSVHPKRPIEGFACTRSEVSGQRFWGLFAREFATREKCFARMFVWNFCPLAFLSESGANITPDKLPRDEREAIERPCERALAAISDLLRPRLVSGVGAFARAAAERALAGAAHAPAFGQILHPSPASPAANRGWEPQARAELVRLGVLGR